MVDFLNKLLYNIIFQSSEIKQMPKYITTIHHHISQSEVETLETNADNAFDAQIDTLKMYFADIEMCNGEEEETAWDIAKQIVRDTIKNKIVVVNDLFCHYTDVEGEYFDANTIITTVQMPG